MAEFRSGQAGLACSALLRNQLVLRLTSEQGPLLRTISTATEPAKPKSKSAAKNAKRKEKRQAEQAGAAAAGSGAVDAAAAAVQSLSLSSGCGDGGAVQAPAAAAGPATAAEEPLSIEKQIKKIKKKVQQAEALAVKKVDGAALSAEEEAKLDRLAAWQEELRQLEAQL